MSYSPPSSAKPFTLNVSDEALLEWRQLLQLSKLGPDTYENQQTKHNYGVTKKWLSHAKDYWLNTYDWRTHEKHINSFKNYKMEIDGINTHFIGHFSKKKDAIPIVFLHGWPGSFLEFIPMLEIIRKKWDNRDLPYHIIVPSLPGFTLSAETQPIDRDWTVYDTAKIINQLMLNLGFKKYLAQGGDVGSFEAQHLAKEYEGCVGVHLNLFNFNDQSDPSTLSTIEKEALGRSAEWKETGHGYGVEHGTRPSTIGHVLSSNPLAQLAWIGEKFLEWTDEELPLDTILTDISLYWFTSSFPRSIYPYRALLTTEYYEYKFISKPTGFSFFPRELFPGIKSSIEKQCNLVFYKQHQRGGHFAALEQPEEFWEDVQEFARHVWKL